MKKLVVTGLFLITGFICYGQSGQREDRTYLWPENEATNKYDFSASIYKLNVGIDVLYSSAKGFVYSHFQKENDSILSVNDTTKSIVCKGAYPAVVPELGERGKGYVGYTFTLSCNNFGYRFSITDLEHFSSTTNGVVGGPLESDKASSGGVAFPRRYWEGVKEKCYYNIQMTIEQLKEFMDKHTAAPTQ